MLTQVLVLTALLSSPLALGAIVLWGAQRSAEADQRR